MPEFVDTRSYWGRIRSGSFTTRLSITGVLTLAACQVICPAPELFAAEKALSMQAAPARIQLVGLTPPAVVSGSIFLSAANLPSGVEVTFYADDRLIDTQRSAPYWLGGTAAGKPIGFVSETLQPGDHQLKAIARWPDGSVQQSDPLPITVVPSINGSFSNAMSSFANQPSAQANDPDTILLRTSTPGAIVSASEAAVRRSVVSMYRNWGIDLSLDYLHDQSHVLSALSPANPARPAPRDHGAPWSLSLSPDAPFYHAIPSIWPRVALPAGYIQSVQLNTAHDGDGIGFGEVVADASSPLLTIRSQWYANLSTLRTFQFRIPVGWEISLPFRTSADSHMIFIDPEARQFVSAYKTTRNLLTLGAESLYASDPTTLDGLGDSGGSVAANFAELPALIQPGEMVDPNRPIAHAIGGPVSRVWAARVFPATAWDAGVRTGVNTCTGKGYINSGLVPYGGVIQLDPSLDLTREGLTLPALRVLTAMQTYGYYVMDFGCTDIDIYTAADAAELAPYGGPWGSKKGVGVQNEIQRVLNNHTLFVVAPLIKKQ